MPEADAGVTVRPMGPGDVPRVAALEAEAFSRPWSEGTFRRLLEEPVVLCRVVAIEGEVVGYGVVMAVLDQGEIANLAIDPQHRGRGLGRRLLDALLEDAGQLGVTRVHLEVRRSNRAARALYATRGFTDVGTRRDYYESPREDALVMMLELDTTRDNGAGS